MRRHPNFVVRHAHLIALLIFVLFMLVGFGIVYLAGQ